MSEETVAQYRGVIAIEWPAATRPGPHGCLNGRLVSITDATSGKLVTTCAHADVTVHADAGELVTADLTLFADEDGEPILDGLPVMGDGEFLTGTFPFLVAEMRVRELEPASGLPADEPADLAAHQPLGEPGCASGLGGVDVAEGT